MKQEYASRGSLSSLLGGVTEQGGVAISDAVLLRAAMQVCEGMEFLAAEKLIHRDLAARNVLVFAFDAVNPNRVRVKVSDYGLAKIAASYYSKNSVEAAVPIRWMPPEALRTRGAKWSEKSDVSSSPPSHYYYSRVFAQRIPIIRSGLSG